MDGYYLYIDKSLENPYLLSAGEWRPVNFSGGWDSEEFDFKRRILYTSNKNEIKIMIDLLGLRIEKYKIRKRQYDRSHCAILKLVK